MTALRREPSAPRPQNQDNTSRNRLIRGLGFGALGAGALYLAQGDDEKDLSPQVDGKAPVERCEPVRVFAPHKPTSETPSESTETQAFSLGDIPLVREGFDVYDENRLSWSTWKSEDAKQETLRIYRDLLERMVLDQSDEAIHIYVQGAENPDLLIVPGETVGSELELVVTESGRPTFRTPEMNIDDAAGRIESFVSDALMHEAQHLYTEAHGEQPVDGILDEYEHDRESPGEATGDTGNNMTEDTGGTE